MPRPCSICSHVNRHVIETELHNGAAFRNIGARYQVSPSAVFRHQQHVAKSLKAPDVESGANALARGHSPDNERLTLRRKLFVEHYLVTRNGTQSAKLAGYTGDDHVLGVTASRLLGNASIRAEIDERIRPFILSADEVLSLLSSQANGSIDDLLSKDGRLDLAKARNNGAVRLIKKLHFNKGGQLQSLELHDAQSAMQLLGRKYKMFTDKIETNPQPDEQDELKSQIVDEIARRYHLSEKRAQEIVVDVFSESEPPSELVSDSVS